MEQTNGGDTTFQTMRARYSNPRPQSIVERLGDWAFCEAESVDDAIRELESIDCAGCHSPAPITYHEMAAEVGRHWDEIDLASDAYREATGEAWAPEPGQNFLTHLWFAYEWLARDLACRIRTEAAGGEAGAIDIHALLTGRRQIAAIWGIEDVQGIRPDLSDEQAWSVLQAVSRHLDSETGINWDVLAGQADTLFGASPEPADEED